MLADSEENQVGQLVRWVAVPGFVGLPGEMDISIRLTNRAGGTIESHVTPEDPESGYSCHCARNQNLSFLFHGASAVEVACFS